MSAPRSIVCLALAGCLIHGGNAAPFFKSRKKAAPVATAPVAAVSRSVTKGAIAVTVTGVTDAPWPYVEAELDRQLDLAPDATPSAPLADDLAFFSRQQLLILGYPDARIDWKLANGGILLTAFEGDHVTVGTVSFEGATEGSQEDMEKYLLRATHERLGFFTRKTPFVVADIEQGVDYVRRYFQSLGYLDADVKPPIIEPAKPTREGRKTVKDEPGEAVRDLRIVVHMGPQSVFGNTVWAGDALDADALEEAGWPAPGEAFNEVRLENARKNLVGRLQERGHFAALVTTDAPMTTGGGSIPVKTSVVQGPVFKVRSIDPADSFSSGAQRVIEATYHPAEGLTYSPSGLESLHRRAVDTEIFSRLEVQPKIVGPDELELDFSGEEGKRKTLRFYLGYETFKGPIVGAEWRHANFLNSGRGLALAAEGNALGYDGSVKWREPAFLGTSWQWQPEVSALTQEIFDYQRRAYSFRSPFSLQTRRHYLFGATLGYSDERARSDVLTDEELGPKHYSYGNVRLSALVDYRNSPLVPTKGWMASYAIETARDSGGEGGDFLRQDLLLAGYYPFNAHWRVAGAFRTSRIDVDGGVGRLPIDRRLFNGGATTVRSFAEREMGPKARGETPLGGTATQSASFELSYSPAANLEFALFGDSGMIAADDRDDSLSSFDVLSGQWRHAIGIGFRYHLPVGPLRIDYGVNPNPRDGESRGALHITFGFAF